MKKKDLNPPFGGFFAPSGACSEWHICPGCGGRFTVNRLFKGDDEKFYCDGCLRAAEVGK